MSQEISGVIVGDGTIYSSPTTQLDSELSSTSTNAVQNKVITTALGNKQDKLTFDTTPTANSTNPVTSGGIKTALDAIASSAGADLNDILPKTAAAHNSVFRGKDLTSYESSGGMSKAIQAGTFDDIFIGDYVTKKVTIDGTTYTVTWVVADLDYMASGSTWVGTNMHHAVLIPDKTIFSAEMNNSNTTSGGFIGSAMWTTTIPLVNTGVTNAFGSSHILSYSDYLTSSVNTSNTSYTGQTGVTNNNTRTTISCCCIPNEVMVYGHNVFASSPFYEGMYSACTKQLAYYRYNKWVMTHDNKFNYEWFWLRDVVSSAIFANADYYGNARWDFASDSCGVRPYFLYH